MTSIAIVDDNIELFSSLARLIERDGYKVHTFSSGKDFLLKFVQNNKFRDDLAVLLLDITMPKMNGKGVLQALKKEFPDTKLQIIMFSSDDDYKSKVAFLNLGASDYIDKTMITPELLARVKRSVDIYDAFAVNWTNENLNDMEILDDSLSVKFKGVDLELTKREFYIVRALLRHPNVTLTYSHLTKLAFETDVIVSSKTIKAHMYRIRKKIDQKVPAFSTRFVSINGIGVKYTG